MGARLKPATGAISVAWVLILAFDAGCGGRSEECAALQGSCNPSAPAAGDAPPPGRAPRPGIGSPSPPGSGTATIVPPREPPVEPAADEWSPPLTIALPSRPPAPPTEVGAPLPTLAEAVGCVAGAAGPRAAELESGCHAPTPYYEGSLVECSQRWCSRPALPIVASCAPIAVSFAGGYHYRERSADFDVDLVFAPVAGPNDPTPARENLSGLSLRVELGETHLGVPVGTTLYLSASEVFAAGLDVVDGVLSGDLLLAGLERGVMGPFYQPGCESLLDGSGREVPGECACRFASVVPSIRVWLPLGPLDAESPAPGPGEPPPPDEAGAVDAGAAGSGSELPSEPPLP